MFEFDINKYLFVNKTTQHGYIISAGEIPKQSERIYFRSGFVPLPGSGVPVLRVLVPISTYHNGNYILLGLVNNSSFLDDPSFSW